MVYPTHGSGEFHPKGISYGQSHNYFFLVPKLKRL